MPDPGPPHEAAPDQPPDADPPAGSLRSTARDRLLRFNTAVLTRLNLGGLLAAAALVCTVDFLFVGDLLWGWILTGAEVLLALPWAYAVSALDRTEERLARRRIQDRIDLPWAAIVKTVAFGVFAVNLGAKFNHLLGAPIEELLPHSSVYRQYVLFYFAIFVGGLFGRGNRAARVLASVADHPARLMALSFGVVALLGGFVLTLPVSLRAPETASFVDGLFTSTSAVCVTGLVVNDVGATYSTFGQAVILVLIQAGGIGIMSLTAFLVIAAGRRLRVRSTAVLAEMMDTESMAALRRTIRHIVTFTLAIEALGAASLFLAFLGRPEVDLGPESPHPGAGAGGAMWSAVFHSVSAFCNAGFSLSHGNLTAFSASWWICGTIGALVALGGIGFPVLEELYARVRERLAGGRPPRMTLHARVVLLMSALLILGGTLAFLVLEWNGTLANRPVHERLLASAFQSVTTRTAGFNTVDFGKMVPTIVLVSCLLMFIGASPGSTGGGIKTTTFAVLLSVFRAETKSLPQPRLLDRALPSQTVQRALSVAVISLVIQFVLVLALLLTEGELLERHRDDALGPLRIVFEVMSAFATCGLSTGITPELSVAGKLVVTITMLVGRIGPLTFALAAAAKPRGEAVVPPEERVLIG